MPSPPARRPIIRHPKDIEVVGRWDLLEDFLIDPAALGPRPDARRTDPSPLEPEVRSAAPLCEAGSDLQARLADLIVLARYAEAKHRSDDAWPHGLEEELLELQDELEWIDARGAPASTPVGQDAVVERINRLADLTRDYHAPVQASRTWRLTFELCADMAGRLPRRRVE